MQNNQNNANAAVLTSYFCTTNFQLYQIFYNDKVKRKYQQNRNAS